MELNKIWSWRGWRDTNDTLEKGNIREKYEKVVE